MPKTKEDFLADCINEKINGHNACGIGDPYPHDVASRMAYEAYIALGGTEEEANAAYRKAMSQS